MLLNSAQFSEEDLTKETVKKIGDSLENNKLRLVSIRECTLTDVSFKRLMKNCGLSKSLLQLTLNVGIVTTQYRIELLAQALRKNKTLKGLFIHGNPIGDKGMKVIAEALTRNSNISTLDIGDCQLGDSSIQHIKKLLVPEEGKPSLTMLNISANTDITANGWASLAMAVANSVTLRSLYVDYNHLGDSGASCLLVGVAAGQLVEVLDLEGTGLTEKTAQLLLDLVQNYPGALRKVSLSGNKVRKSTVAVIKTILRRNHESEDGYEESESEILSSTTGTSTSQAEEAEPNLEDGIEEISLETSKAESEDETSTINGSIIEVSHDEGANRDEIEKTEIKELKAENNTPTPGEEFGDELKEVPVYW